MAHEKEAPAMPRTMLFTGNVVNTQKEELVDREETKLEVIEAMIKGIAVKKIDPTQKASEMLTKALLEQQKMHAVKKSKSEPTSIRSARRKPYARITAKANVESKKRKPEKIATNHEKPAKKTKIAQEVSSKGTINTEFGFLKMAPLKQYEIPMNIADIEKKIDDGSYVTLIKRNIEYSLSDPEHYINAYAALLYLTETAESISLQEFNQKFIRLSYSKVGRTFQIKNSVSSI